MIQALMPFRWPAAASGGVLCGQHDDGGVHSGCWRMLLQQAQAIEYRHVEVGQDQVDLTAIQHVQSLLCHQRLAYGMASAFQCHFHHQAQAERIVDDQDGFAHGLPLTRFNSRCVNGCRCGLFIHACMPGGST
jgi:hypothetical protein